MATEDEILAHDQLLTSTTGDLQSAVEDRSKTVERRLAELILSQPNNAALIQNRALLLRAFSDIDNIGSILPEALAQIAADTIALQGLGERTAEDTQSQTVLADLAQNQLSTELENTKNTIIDNIILGAVAGVALEELAIQSRVAVSGVMADIEGPGVRDLQRRLVRLEAAPQRDKTAIQSTVRELTAAIGTVARGATLRELGKRVVGDTVMNFEGAFSRSRAVRNNVKRYEYVGGVIETTRPFCEDLDGSILTEEEIYDIWDTEDWAGKAPGDPFIVHGGYNCRHWWVPIVEDDE